VNASVKTAHAVEHNLIQRTLEVWQPRLGRDLTREDARQITENMVGFFEILNKWRIGETTVLSTVSEYTIDAGAESKPTTERAKR
jgi:hypothetical protein